MGANQSAPTAHFSAAASKRLHGARLVVRSPACRAARRPPRELVPPSHAGCPPAAAAVLLACDAACCLLRRPCRALFARRRLPAIRLRRRPRSACPLAALNAARSARDSAHIRTGTWPTSEPGPGPHRPKTRPHRPATVGPGMGFMVGYPHRGGQHAKPPR